MSINEHNKNTHPLDKPHYLDECEYITQIVFANDKMEEYFRRNYPDKYVRYGSHGIKRLFHNFMEIISQVADCSRKEIIKMYYEFCINDLGYNLWNDRRRGRHWSRGFLNYYRKTRVPSQRQQALNKLEEAGYM